MFLAVASCFAAGCSVNESLENETVTVPAAKILGTPGEDAVKGSILVYLDDDMLARMSSGSVTKGAESDPDFSEIFPGVGIDGARKVFRSIDENNMDEADMSLRHWYRLSFDEGLSLTEVAEALAGLDGVQRVQYNVRIHSDVEPVVYTSASAGTSISSHAAAVGQDPVFNDPKLSLQWHYSNDGSVCRAAVPGADINVMDAWRLTAGDRDIIVAVVDDAVAYDHPDLAANMWVNEKELNGQPGVDDDDNGYVDDIYGYNFVSDGALSWDGVSQQGHGTHVAGTVAAVNNNGVGVCGVAGGTGNNDGVRLMSCQVLQGEDFAEIPEVADAINYARNNGAVILQCSFGFTSGDVKNDNEFTSVARVEKEAMDAFMNNNRNFYPYLDGGLIIFSAGNSYGAAPGYPGAYTPCVCVTAVGSDGLPALYTSMGYGTNIAAPGGESGTGGYSTPEACVLSTVPSHISADGYAYMEGTSMACPHVSGIAALGLAYAKKLDKHYTRDEFVSMLLTSVNDLDSKLVGSKRSLGIDNKVYSLDLPGYVNNMGTGTIDTWRLLMQIEGTPCLTAAVGVDNSLDLSEYFGGASEHITYQGVDISDEDMAALGLESEPEIVDGKLVIRPTEYGSGKLTVRAIGGGEFVGGGMLVGGMTISKEISIVTRGVASAGGGWL